MKKIVISLLISVICLCVISRIISSSDDANPPKIKIALRDSIGGGAIYVLAKPFAHGAGASESRDGNTLISVVEFSYDVDKDVKNVKATYAIHESGATRFSIIEKNLPISNKIDMVPVGQDFKAYATYVK